MDLKKSVRRILTCLRYPLFVCYLKIKDNTRFTIDKGLQINRFRGVTIGDNVAIGRNARFLIVPEYCGEKYQPRINIGNNVSIGNRFSVLSAAEIIIKDDNLIASDVLITSENHGTDPEQADSYAATPLVVSPVIIGKGCWIGEKVSILPGVTLGDRCIVAANSVVTHSFPDKTMIAGMPARAIKQYSDDEHRWKKVSND